MKILTWIIYFLAWLILSVVLTESGISVRRWQYWVILGLVIIIAITNRFLTL